MKKILILLLFFLLNFSSETVAEESITSETQAVTEKQENAQGDAQIKTDDTEVGTSLSEEEKLEINIPSQQVELTVEKNFPIQKINLPTCDNEQLLELTKDYISSYFANSKNEGNLYRRYRHFILHNLNQFREVNIADYKTAQARPVSDIIADIKVNKGILEENIRVCKNQSEISVHTVHLDRQRGLLNIIQYNS